MTAPQVIATIFFLVSVGSATTLALMAAASAVLDAVAKTCDRARPDAGRDRSRRVTEAACRLRRAALARAAIP
ncbi:MULTISPECIES: hypothetical protein [Methylobacterium]|jgi:hypothetical protein|uniref:hypothetical protein n=1 Tax=Methylobacterium TaxID=407 RepID=UPI0003466C7C|nr:MULTISPECIES: hypothetical protein [Methylobacterium]KQS84914.1 hypothetical protein ASG32_19560 [Methylobacterium sp. Leaf361]MBN4095231.1 hypothetical protein [Methylobacterium sp. OT2]UIN32395.1 hypothetical protein LXM90_14800 [Methylobacterium oryzae]SEF88522.1 hypothetical protein SAMN04488144_10677 [Methylobacterium sp. 190mf]SEH32287.1 hypothetical protein SAMN02799636_01220 [Methylobacterium sp. 275MFSha3.1]